MRARALLLKLASVLESESKVRSAAVSAGTSPHGKIYPVRPGFTKSKRPRI